MSYSKLPFVNKISFGCTSYITSCLLLFIPFLIGFISLWEMPFNLQTSFAWDEFAYHYPTILKFAKQLPYPDIRNYHSATTPLFHLLFACIGKVVGTDVMTLRIVNVFICYIGVVILYMILRKRFKLKNQYALIYAFIFALSPYYFRNAFVIVTDNLPIVWLLCFLNFYIRYKNEDKQWLYLLSMLFLALLALTRQTYLFVWAAAMGDQVFNINPLRKKLINLSWGIAAALPTFIFFVIWGGLTPPFFAVRHTQESFLNIRPILWGLSILGLYSIFIPDIKSFKNLFLQKGILTLCSVLLAWISLFFFPLTKAEEDVGYLWHIENHMPSIAGSSLLFYFLISFGVMALLAVWQKEGFGFLVFFLLGIMISEVPSKYIFQRYYDSSILVGFIFFSAGYHELNKIDLYRRFILIVFFIVYFVVYIKAYN